MNSRFFGIILNPKTYLKSPILAHHETLNLYTAGNRLVVVIADPRSSTRAAAPISRNRASKFEKDSNPANFQRAITLDPCISVKVRDHHGAPLVVPFVLVYLVAWICHRINGVISFFLNSVKRRHQRAAPAELPRCASLPRCTPPRPTALASAACPPMVTQPSPGPAPPRGQCRWPPCSPPFSVIEHLTTRCCAATVRGTQPTTTRDRRATTRDPISDPANHQTRNTKFIQPYHDMCYEHKTLNLANQNPPSVTAQPA